MDDEEEELMGANQIIYEDNEETPEMDEHSGIENILDYYDEEEKYSAFHQLLARLALRNRRMAVFN